MNEAEPPVEIALEVGMLDITLSLTDTEKRLSDDAHLMLEHIKSNGLGITKLEQKSLSTYYIEHQPQFSGTNIIRYFGNLAREDLGSDIRFLRPDGQLHSIQLDPKD